MTKQKHRYSVIENDFHPILENNESANWTRAL